MENREKYFLGSTNTFLLTHTWGTGCNISCPFCLNEGTNNLNLNKTSEINFKLSEMFSNLDINDVLYIEHGGELLYCKYTNDLLEFKTSNIKNYRALFFTNGTSFVNYELIINKFKKYLEPYLSFQISAMSNTQSGEFIKCLEYNISEFGYCNISFVYYTELDLEYFKKMFSLLFPYKDKIKIKVFFDKNFLERNLKHEIIKSYNFMSYLDAHFMYKNLLQDVSHITFKEKTKFLLESNKQKDLKQILTSAIEVVNDKIILWNSEQKPEIYNTQDYMFLDSLKESVLRSASAVINTETRNFINQTCELR